MKNILFLLMVICICVPNLCLGQGYIPGLQHRPTGLNWQQLETPHFRVIFPGEEDSLAYRSAAILESQYAAISELAGGTLKNFPVILNNYNDRSNGYVTSFNFRSEVDLTANKGKGMNPQTGDWLEIVLPHELVHAAHFNVQQPLEEKKVSIPNFLSFFSPDLARSVHGIVPVGVHEGLAVYHETHAIAPMGGRGNAPYFVNRFNANFASEGRWNMGQTFIPSDYTQPFDRHYIAGYHFTNWLHNNYGENISRKAIRFHYHHFFLGYGYALKRKTGSWPRTLYGKYEADLEQEENQRLSSLGESTTEKSLVLELPFKGEEVHGPRWLSDHSLLFYGSYYNGRIGFYRYDLNSGELDLLRETFSVGDFYYQLQGEDKLVYAAYTHKPTLPGVYVADVNRLNLRTGENEPLTTGARVHAPAATSDRILAIKAEGPAGSIVEIHENGEVETLKSFEHAMPVSIKFNPKKPNQVAVVVNKRGVQALWLTPLSSLAENLDRPPTLAFRDASIYDPEWHPDGTTLLFTADANAVMNIYEYEMETGALTQITNSYYNAFEGAYRADGQQIAYVLQAEDERKLAVLGRPDFYDNKVTEAELLTGEELHRQLDRPYLGAAFIDSVKTYETNSYKSGVSWLKPRAVYPVYREQANTPQYGAGFSSIDALSSQAYSAEITGIQNRLWYDFTYANKMFYPGFKIQAYSEPSFSTFQATDNGTSQTVMRQDRGLTLSVPFEYFFRGDTRLSSIYLSPEITAEQFRYYDLSPTPISDFTNRYKAGFFSQLNLGILNLRRDIQPSSGLSFFGLYEETLNRSTYSIALPNANPSFRIKNQWAAYYGVFGFLSPLRKWNQSLRVDLQFLQQSRAPLYSNSTIRPMGFVEAPFPNVENGEGVQHLGRFSTRYTIPIFYPDTGLLTVPLYLSSIYLTTFTHTLTDMNNNDLLGGSRSIFGAGLHLQFKVSNLLLDFGVGLAYEPTRKNTQFIFGQF